MCGIGAVIDFAEAGVAQSLPQGPAIKALEAAQAHRGPDGLGISYFGAGAPYKLALAHQRLAIKVGGVQPI